MPGEGIFVPPGPEESEKESAGGKDVAGAAQEHLARRGRISGEAGNVESAEHHTGRGSAEYGEESEILQVDDGEREGIDGCAEFAEGELTAKGTEEREETAVSEKQAGDVDRRGKAPFLKGSDGVKAACFR